MNGQHNTRVAAIYPPSAQKMMVVRTGRTCFSSTVHACRHDSTSSGRLSATVSFQEYMSTPATVQGQRQGGKDERGASECVLDVEPVEELGGCRVRNFWVN